MKLSPTWLSLKSVVQCMYRFIKQKSVPYRVVWRWGKKGSKHVKNERKFINYVEKHAVFIILSLLILFFIQYMYARCISRGLFGDKSLTLFIEIHFFFQNVYNRNEHKRLNSCKLSDKWILNYIFINKREKKRRGFIDMVGCLVLSCSLKCPAIDHQEGTGSWILQLSSCIRWHAGQ
jgi:hypothetical protein